ncbi:hypothetical protein [[Clostridium] polysaccharolyticum]|uniref:Uncharacterized protein n=1 Tax=[Clostridium] polysaccharolyticum TaxID=29364 RepID=A0A1H9Y6I7_9FIRM|nr:hypothetical protein [[Clostridium] polysaccharolyticum]SES64368.1 hypothetical protein SAMN04487772_101166 [[Clostridium] polysaccharolyticum]
MPLIHQFMMIEKESNIDFIEDWMDKIDVSDNLILYIKDSLKWMKVSCNDEMSSNNGLNYYGYSIIKGENIRKFKTIINCWIRLFQEAPEEFTLTGDFLSIEDRYEFNSYIKQEVLNQLEALETMCKGALERGSYILHNGI